MSVTLAAILTYLLHLNPDVSGSSLEQNVQFNVTEGNKGPVVFYLDSTVSGIPAGTIVGSIHKLEGFQYRLTEPNAFFGFNQTTGEIYTLIELDRELLPNGDESEVDLVILGTSPTYFITAKIRVLDINDNAPSFPFPYQNVSLPENAKVGTQMVLVGASDPDAGPNSSVSKYAIVGADSQCCSISNDSNGMVLILILTSPLDREEKDLYMLNISATDLGSPPMTGYTTVFLNVLDANDNAPVFEQSHYVTSMPKVSPPGSQIIQVHATDSDLDQNARLSYRIVSDVGDQFGIDEDSGWIYVKSEPTCEQRFCSTPDNCTLHCTFTVEAVDHGQPPQRGRAFVDIILEEEMESNRQVEIAFRFHPSNGQFAIVEDAKPIGSVVALVSVLDFDKTHSDEWDIRISSGNELGHFVLVPNNGFSMLRINDSLDHFKQQWYNLTLTAVRHQTVSSKTLPIFVKGASIQPPIFQQRFYRTAIREDVPVNSYVVDVLAKLPRDQPVLYSILSGDESPNWFRISENTGLITTANRLDFEKRRSLKLIIAAKSKEPGVEQSMAIVEVNLTDVNDNAPQFVPSSLNITVAENVLIDAPIGHIRAEDADTGLNGEVIYEFCDPKAVESAFSLHPMEGGIIPTKPLDRELQESWRICVQARDRGQPSLNTRATLVIAISDVNDNVPQFYPTYKAVTLLKSDLKGKPVASVQAKDADFGPNGTVSYFFHEAPDDCFGLDNYSGIITLRRWPPNVDQVTLIVGAKDGGGLRSSNNATVVINLIEKADLMPKFSKTTYEFHVDEDFGMRFINSRSIGSVSALDFDSISQVQYRLVDGDPDGIFEIGPYSGEIRTKSLLNFEAQSSYQLAVLAVGRYASGSALVKILLRDLNDNPPEFSDPIFKAEVEDETPSGHSVLYAPAFDEDSNDNALISYYSKTSADFIKVDPNTGLVSLTRAGFLILPGIYNVTIWAHDSGSPPLTASTVLTINVIHRKEVPTFNRIQLEVPEDTRINQVLLQLNGSEFFIEDAMDTDLFGVFPDGHIYVKNELDYEQQNFEQFEVRSSNGPIEVNLYIMDVNDNAPTCNQASFEFVLDENSPPLTYVGTVSADDPDSELNGMVRYRFVNKAEDRFLLDPATGDLITLVTLDREEMYRQTSSSKIYLSVEAYDLGKPESLKTVCQVSVEVNDQNDHVPQFTLTMYTATIAESKEQGTEVLRISARDEDLGVNGLVTFSLESGDPEGHFKLNSTSGLLSLESALDREKQAIYRLKFHATDGGEPQLTSHAFATIVVQDVNDNRPEFSSASFVTTLPEDTALGKCVFQVQARDRDSMANGAVTYSFPTGPTSGPFYIDHSIGCLALIRPLDFERKNNYTLTIVATDGGSPRLSSTAALNILVTDVNDNEPVFHARSLVGHIALDSPPGTEVLTLSAVDIDSGPNGLIRFSLLHQYPEDLFRLDAKTGRVVLNRRIPQAAVDSYKLLVQAEDQAEEVSLRRRTRRIVTIAVRPSTANNGQEETTKVLLRPHAVLLPSDSLRAGQFVVKIHGHQGDLKLAPNCTGLPFAITPDGDIYIKQPIVKPRLVYELRFRGNYSEVYLLLNGSRSQEFTFGQDVYSLFVKETTRPGMAIGQLSMNTGPSLAAQYFLVDSTPEMTVDVDQWSGQMVVVSSMDANHPDNGNTISTLVVAVAEDRGQPLIAECTVRITVVDENNTPPHLSEDFYRFEVTENASVDTLIGCINATDRDSRSQLAFSLHGHEDQFKINPTTGVLSTAKDIIFPRESVYLLSVRVDDGIHVSSAPVEITVVSSHEDSPQFLNTSYLFPVTTPLKSGQLIGCVETIRSQSGQYEYGFMKNAKVGRYIRIEQTTGLLFVNTPWDAAKVPLIQFQVEAVNNKDSNLKNYSNVCVVVENAHETPEFKKPLYEISVSENASLEEPLLSLELQTTNENLYYYHILHGDPEQHFWISRTGNLYLNKALDREQRHTHHLIVAAHDQPALEQSLHVVSTSVTIAVLDINDEVPKFAMPNVYALKPNAHKGTAVATLKAVDADQGINGHVRYMLEPENATDFSIDPVRGLLTLRNDLNGSDKGKYYVTVWAFDHGYPVLNSSMTVHILVPEVKAAKLSAQVEPETIQILDNVPVGYVVATVQTPNSLRPAFWLSPGDHHGDFVMHPTGELVVTRRLSSVRHGFYKLQLNIRDELSGHESQMVTCEVTINVTKGSMGAPVFLESRMHFKAVENLTPLGGSTLLGSVHAVSRNPMDTAHITYSMIRGNSSLFSLDPISGEVLMLVPLDREEHSNHTLLVQAAHSGHPSLVSNREVFIDVTDSNDNPPVFDQPSYQGELMENQPAGSYVLTIRASDVDAGTNGEVVYMLLEKNIPFAIHPKTGALTTTEALDREIQASWTLKAVAEDCGAPALRSKEVYIRISVSDANDNEPEFGNSEQNVYVMNSLRSGDFVYAVDAADPDEGDNGVLMYQLCDNGDEHQFSINKTTGVIRAKSYLRVADTYRITVRVSDNGQPRREAFLSLQVLTRPPSEFPLFKTGSEQLILVAENQYDSLVTTFAAVSLKQAPFNRIRYSILAGNVLQAFRIDSESGELFTTDKMDYETHRHYELVIAATDSDGTPLSAFTSITVDLTDVNDNAPIFDQLVYTTEIAEEEEAPLHVVRVHATDRDHGSNGAVLYSMAEGTSSEFEIDPKTGVIITTTPLDRETVSLHWLTVIATDQGRPALSSNATVVIKVEDKNDNAPKFTRLFSASVQEGAPVGTYITQVTSTDVDEMPNTTYQLLGDFDRIFRMNPRTGEIFLAKVLDRESCSEYAFKVAAMDGVWRVETSLTILVEDVNDNVPQFSRHNYSFYVSEEERPLHVLGRVSASDADVGANSEITFRLRTPSPFFSINSVTGDITIRRLISYHNHSSAKNEFQFDVIASDHGRPVLWNQTTVKVLVLARGQPILWFVNLDKPLPVPFDVPSSTLVHHVKVATNCQECKINFRMLITSEEFDLDRSTGWLRTKATTKNHSIGEECVLAISAETDSGSSTTSTLRLVFTGDNAHSPEFVEANYTVSVSEQASIGSTVFSVAARDKDSGLDGSITYGIRCIEPAHACPFTINPDLGTIRLTEQLNREWQGFYKIDVTATDGGFKPRSSYCTLNIIVEDENDNRPMFDEQKFEILLNVAHRRLGDVVHRFHAFDADQAPNDQLFYAIIAKHDPHSMFALNSSSGELNLVRIPSGANGDLWLKVRCSNPNSEMFDDQTLFVHLLGSSGLREKVLFAHPIFQFFTPLMPEQRGVVGFLKSRHQTERVHYFIGIDALDNLFQLDRSSGALKQLHQMPMRSAQFSVVAKRNRVRQLEDFDLATVRLTQADNGSGPIFAHTVHRVKVPEDASIGSIVATLNPAHDCSGACRFSILEGNVNNTFGINQKGDLILRFELDWESLNHYRLTVVASRKGTGQILASTTVQLTVEDVNDNGPSLHPSNCIGYVSENDPIGSQVIALMPYDLDSVKNQGPFSYHLYNNSLFTLDPKSGVLSTRAQLDREQRDQYKLSVVISDSGSPPMSTAFELTIYVTDVNDEPSEAQTVTVTLIHLQQALPDGTTIHIHPVDKDLTGQYRCRPLQMGTDFMIDEKCVLNITRVPADWQRGVVLRINGDDGLHPSVNYDTSLNFQAFDKDTISNAITCVISGIRSDLFEHVIQPLRLKLEDEGYASYPLSIQCSNSVCEVYMVTFDSSRHPTKPRITLTIVSEIWRKWPPQDKRVLQLFDGICQNDTCGKNGRCVEAIDSDGQHSEYRESSHVLAYPRLRRSFSCSCDPGFTGARCQTLLENCRCKNGGVCSDGRCHCSSGFSGDQCEQDLDECQLINPCRNNGVCLNLPGSYRCSCKSGFAGRHCEQTADFCSKNPCLNGGVCETNPDGYECSCKFAYTGRHCEIASFGFNDLSYVQLGGLQPRSNDILFDFATIRKKALLVFSSDGRNASTRGHFFAVDILNGKLRLVCTSVEGYACGATLAKNVSDGRWHRLQLRQEPKTISISVAPCTPSGCSACREDHCKTVVNLPKGFISMGGEQTLFLGGVDTPERLGQASGRLKSPSFLGCIRALQLNGLPLTSQSIRGQSNLLDHCPREDGDLCDSPTVCPSGAYCIDRWDHAVCLCRGNFLAESCSLAFAAFRLEGGFVSYEMTELTRLKKMYAATFAQDAFQTWSEDRHLSVRRNLPPRWLNVEFKTDQLDGVLFFASTGAQFTLIDVVNGSVRYTSRTDDLRTVQLKLTDGPFVSDGGWHMVSLAVYAEQVEFRIDDYGKDAKMLARLHDFFDSRLTSFSIGGTRNVVKAHGARLTNFNGCMRRFILNGELQPWLISHRHNLLRVQETRHMGASELCAQDDIGCTSGPCAPNREGMLRNTAREHASLTAAVIFSASLILSALVILFLVRRYRPCVKVPRKRTVSVSMQSRLSSLPVLSNTNLCIHQFKDLVQGNDSYEPCQELQCAGSRLGDSGISLNASSLGFRHPVHREHLYRVAEHAEHYDLENASSIAPSDIDVAYHYKLYHEHSGTTSDYRSIGQTSNCPTISRSIHSTKGAVTRRRQVLGSRVADGSSSSSEALPPARLSVRRPRRTVRSTADRRQPSTSDRTTDTDSIGNRRNRRKSSMVDNDDELYSRPYAGRSKKVEKSDSPVTSSEQSMDNGYATGPKQENTGTETDLEAYV